METRKFRAYKMTDEELEAAKIRIIMAKYPPSQKSLLSKMARSLLAMLHFLGGVHKHEAAGPPLCFTRKTV